MLHRRSGAIGSDHTGSNRGVQRPRIGRVYWPRDAARARVDGMTGQLEVWSAEPYESAKPVAGLRYHLLALAFAIVGGVLGIMGALVAEARSTAPFLLAFVGAPVVEEIVKPVGIYLFIMRWRTFLQNQLYIAWLVAISGLCFGLVESTVYVTLYVSDPSQAFVAYRFTVTVALHTVASFIAGLGVNAALVGWAMGEGPFPRASRWTFGSAIALHALYNTTAVVLSLTGVLDFD
jgi:RsiW-degrading membrane proteinase PrsW (M82 family)